MKTQINCDDVFDVLTRGPFPSGTDEDEAVERHLAGCHECRRLAEALRPAVALFHEVLFDQEGSKLPEYRGKLPSQQQLPSLNVLAVDVVHSNHRRRQLVREDQISLANGVRIACGMLLAVALCFVVWSFGSFVNKTQQILAGKSPPRFSAANVRYTAHTQKMLSAVSFSSECLPPVTPGRQRTHLCCTGCHSAAHPSRAECLLAWGESCLKCHEQGAPPRLRTREIAIAQQSCQACHDG